MNRNTNRALLMAVVGGYVIYLAYELLQNLLKGQNGAMSPALSVIVIIFFTAAGVAVLIYAWKIHKEPPEEDPVVVEEEAETADSQAAENGEARRAESSSGSKETRKK